MSVVWTTRRLPNHFNTEVFKINRQKNGKVAQKQRQEDGEWGLSGPDNEFSGSD